MDKATKQLPNDVDALKKIIADKQQHIHLLEEQLRLERHRQFGAKSEKHPGQGELFNEAEQSADDDTTGADEAADTETITYTRKKAAGRKPLPEHLPRVRIEHELPESEQACPCGCTLSVIGEETSEQLDIIPAKARVLVHVRKKYACRQCESGVKTASLPLQPIPKSNASPGLLAHIAVAKYQDALPLYRQQQIFKRMDINLPRNTLASWMMKMGTLVQPLLNLMDDQLLLEPLVHCDETPIQVLKEPDKPAQSKSYMWVRVSGSPDKRIILYDYASSRSGEVAKQLFEGYSGYLQTDDYAGYHAIGKRAEITHLGCWAHARRKFVEAQKVATPKGSKPKAGKADMALSYIRKLYGIEKRIKDEPIEVRCELRQKESLEILKQFRAWLDNTLHKVLPKGALGKALGYLNKNWDKLTIYTEEGCLLMDNNIAENAIRPFVIGRKNWLFSDTPKGAKASAALYSLIETAKANSLEPYAYLRHVFKELPAAKSLEEIEALLPWNITGESLTISV